MNRYPDPVAVRIVYSCEAGILNSAAQENPDLGWHHAELMIAGAFNAMIRLKGCEEASEYLFQIQDRIVAGIREPKIPKRDKETTERIGFQTPFGFIEMVEMGAGGGQPLPDPVPAGPSPHPPAPAPVEEPVPEPAISGSILHRIIAWLQVRGMWALSV